MGEKEAHYTFENLVKLLYTHLHLPTLMSEI